MLPHSKHPSDRIVARRVVRHPTFPSATSTAGKNENKQRDYDHTRHAEQIHGISPIVSRCASPGQQCPDTRSYGSGSASPRKDNRVISPQEGRCVVKRLHQPAQHFPLRPPESTTGFPSDYFTTATPMRPNNAPEIIFQDRTPQIPANSRKIIQISSLISIPFSRKRSQSMLPEIVDVSRQPEKGSTVSRTH